MTFGTLTQITTLDLFLGTVYVCKTLKRCQGLSGKAAWAHLPRLSGPPSAPGSSNFNVPSPHASEDGPFS